MPSKRLLTIVAIAVLLAAVAIVLLSGGNTHEQAWSAETFSGSAERIAAFPELVKLSQTGLRPLESATAKLPFEIAHTPGEAASPTVEWQNLLGAPALMPRPPKVIAAALADKANRSEAEDDALAAAWLDLGQPDRAVALREANVAANPRDEDAHNQLIDLLEQQNRPQRCLEAIDALFAFYVQRGKDQADIHKQRKWVDKARALLKRRTNVQQRALLPGQPSDARVMLIDAFPTQTGMIGDLIEEYANQRKFQALLDLLMPRIQRYGEGRVHLWPVAINAYRQLGKLDEAIRALETDPLLRVNDTLYSHYARLLRDAKLADARSKQLQERLAEKPDAAVLRDLIHLEQICDRHDRAREIMEEQLQRLGADVTADELTQLGSLARTTGLSEQSMRLMLDAVVLAGDNRPDILLRAARRMSEASDGSFWPLGTGADVAFTRNFIDAGPGVVGGLVSLGTNKMGARDAIKNMPATAARVESKRLAIKLALHAARVESNPEKVYEATLLAVQKLKAIEQAERLDAIADKLLARFGKKQKRACEIAAWHADAALLREQTEQEIQALRTALKIGRDIGARDAADRVERRLENCLMKQKRYGEVLALKWQRVEAYPDDEQAVEALLRFAEQHRLYEDAERAYRGAIKRFDRKTWSDKFARWLIRRKRTADFRVFVKETAEALGESELADFLRKQLPRYQAKTHGNAFIEQIYRIALKRFPANVSFNRELLAFYESKGWGGNRPDPAYQDKFIDLIMRAFMLQPGWTDRLMFRVGQRDMLAGLANKLDVEKTLNPLEAYLWTRVQQRFSRHEMVLQGYAALDEWWPRSDLATQPLAVAARSLTDSFHVRDPQLAVTSADAYGRLADRDPLSINRRTLEGEVMLETGRPRQAAQIWEKIVTVGPGESERWLHLATLYWDYYLPDHALATLVDGRQRLHEPDLHAEEMAYLLEDKGEIGQAVAELVKVVLGDPWSGYDARRRIDYLVRKKKTTQSNVDDAFMQRLTRPGGNGQEGLNYLYYLRERGEIDKMKRIARRLLPHYGETVTTDNERVVAGTAFADGALSLFAQYGDDDGVKACLDRLVEISDRDPAMLRRLVVYYENHNELDRADALVKEIIDAAEGDYARRDARRFAADYYWRTDRIDRALNEYRALAESAVARRAKLGAWITYAARCREADRPQQALTALRKLYPEYPAESSLVGATAAAYAAANDYRGLADFYKQVLKDLRKKPLDPQWRKQREVELRQRLIAALTDLGMPRDAIEEHIQIINRLAPDIAPVLAAHRYARQYNQLKPLLAYYEREAKRAHRDFRWQLVTAVLYEAEGRYADAGAMLDRAIANEPQRNNLVERRALVLIKAGDFDGAVECYRTLASRRLGGEDYQLRIAEVLYLAGRPDEAEAWLDEVLAPEKTSLRRIEQAARLAERFGREATRLRYVGRALDMVMAEPDKLVASHALLVSWLRGQIETIGAERAIVNLSALRDNLQTAKAQAHPVGRNNIRRSVMNIDKIVTGYLAGYLGDYGDAAMRTQARAPFTELLQAHVNDDGSYEWWNSAFAKVTQAAHTAQMPALAADFQRQHLQRLNDRGHMSNRHISSSNAAAKLIKKRSVVEAPADLLRTADTLARLSDHQSVLFQRALLARAAGDAEKEKSLLEKWFDHFDCHNLTAPTGLVARYFHRLSDDELQNLAANQCDHYGPLTWYLAASGRTVMAATALQNHYRRKGPLWLQAKLARLYQYDPEFAEQAHDAYRKLLGLPLIIDKRVHVGPAQWEATGKVWTHYAHEYGAWMIRRDEEGAESLLFAEPERHPLNAQAYLKVAAAYDEAERFDLADDALSRAAAVNAGAYRLTVARAMHEAARGDKKEAARLLGTLIVGENPSLHKVRDYAELMQKIGRGRKALPRWQNLLIDKLDGLSNYDRRDGLLQLHAFAEKVAGVEEADRLITEILPDPVFNANELRNLALNKHVPRSLKTWCWHLSLARSDGDASMTIYSRRRLAEQALNHALTVDDEKLGRTALAQIEKVAPQYYRNGYQVQVQRLRVACRYENTDAAEQLVISFIDEGYMSPRQFDELRTVLQKRKLPVYAHRFTLAYYRHVKQKHDLNIDQKSDRLRSLLALNKIDDAGPLLVELENLVGEDAVRLAELADIAREGKLTDAALRLAERAHLLTPRAFAANRALLLARLATDNATGAATLLTQGYRQRLYGGVNLDNLLVDLAKQAQKNNWRDWEAAAETMPQPLQALTLAHLYLLRDDGDTALDVLAALSEPLDRPLSVWRLRADAARREGDRKTEAAALRKLLRYRPDDNDAAVRRAWLELPEHPFTGLLRMSVLGLPVDPWELAEPLQEPRNMNRVENWFDKLDRNDRAPLAAAIIEALVTLDRPTAAWRVGQATVRTMDEPPRDLTRQLEKLEKQINRRRAEQPVRFVPNNNLVQ